LYQLRQVEIMSAEPITGESHRDDRVRWGGHLLRRMSGLSSEQTASRIGTRIAAPPFANILQKSFRYIPRGRP
jgi:hypothetical protein